MFYYFITLSGRLKINFPFKMILFIYRHSFIIHLINKYPKKFMSLNKAWVSVVVLSLIASVFLFADNTLLQSNLQKEQEVPIPNDMECGFTTHFANFLKNNGYDDMNFQRTDLKCAAFGGKASAKDNIKKIPIIFIHGNSDVGFGRGTADGYVSWQTGFRALATFFADKGYTKAQMYTTTWGPADPNKATQNFHSKEYVMRMRKFVEAVLQYTGAAKITVIGHSMGVTIGRKVIKGGNAIDHIAGTYNVGPSLSSKVNVFIGLAGANLGLASCAMPTLPTCGNKDGFYPGSSLSVVHTPSDFLDSMNKDGIPQGSKVVSMWSQYDNLIGYGCLVFGKVTSKIQGQTATVQKTSPDYDHFAMRDKCGPDIMTYL